MRILDRGQALARHACQDVGLSLMMTAVPIARTLIGIPVASATFATGWALQFAAHAFFPLPEGDGPLQPELDEATADAIEKFEREHKMPMTGQMSDRLVRELGTMIGHPID